MCRNPRRGPALVWNMSKSLGERKARRGWRCMAWQDEALGWGCVGTAQGQGPRSRAGVLPVPLCIGERGLDPCGARLGGGGWAVEGQRVGVQWAPTGTSWLALRGVAGRNMRERASDTSPGGACTLSSGRYPGLTWSHGLTGKSCRLSGVHRGCGPSSGHHRLWQSTRKAAG